MSRSPNGRARRKTVALALLALTVAASPLLLRLGVDNSLEIWIDDASPIYSEYRDFVGLFGSEEYILLIYELPEKPDRPFLERLTDLRLSVEEIEGVARVFDVAVVFSRIGATQGIEPFWREIRGSALYRNFIVSPDGTRAATWITLDDTRQDRRSGMVAEIERTARSSLSGEKFHLAGSPVVNAALDEATRNASRIFFPLVFLASAVVLLVLFRRPTGVIVPFVSVGTGIVWTLSAVALTGRGLNLVTAALTPLVWVLGLSTSIHLMATSRRLRASGLAPDEALEATMRELARPCLYSTLTTAIGFCALVTSPVQPVREMGLFAALGVTLCLVANFVLFPALAGPWLRRPPSAERDRNRERRWNAVFDLLSDRSRRAPLLVVGLCTSIALVSLLGVARLQPDSNVVGFFKESSPISVTYRQVLSGFTGHQSLEIVLRPSAEPTSSASFAALDRLADRVSKVDGVIKVLSPADLLKSAYRRMRGAEEDHLLPESSLDVADAWEMVARTFPQERRAIFSPEDGVFRMTALVTPLGAEDNRRMVEEIDRQIEAWQGPGWEVSTTGLVQLAVDMQRRLLQSQIRSFGLALLIIGPLLALLLRSVTPAFLCLLANLLPVVVTLGVMGAIGIPLDPATVMIAGIALGISVDDGIHFLVRYRRRRDRGAGRSDAIHEALHVVGRPMVITTVVAGIGFTVLCFSSFLPLFYFGILTTLTMFGALVANLTVLPSLLKLGDRSTGEARLQRSGRG